MYGQSDRQWTAIVMGFYAYWAALPTIGWHRLLAGRNCKVKVASSLTNAQSHDEGRGGRRVTGMHEV